MNSWLIRCLDFLLAALGLLVASPLLLLVLFIGLFDTGSPVFAQRRVGRHQRLFTLYKFRTMSVGTASVATHEVESSSITSMGAVLRKTKIDELPQLINVLKGEMSLVGPRPCLPSQQQLILERERCGVFAVLPGITGLAQVNEIDMSTPELLAQWDSQMIEQFSPLMYLKLLVQTVKGDGAGDRVKSK